MSEAIDTSASSPENRRYCAANTDGIEPTVPQRIGCDPTSGLQCEELKSLFVDEEGCRQTRMLADRGWMRWKRTFAKINAGGSHDEYLTWMRFFKERLLPTVRLSDSSPSGSWMFPIAWNVPGFDGWISARWNFFRNSPDTDPQDGKIDIVYSLAAARYFSTYVAAGRDTLPMTDKNNPRGHKVGIEGGIKWRFEAPKIGLFSGVRIGIRADDPTHLAYPRMVFEIGGGSW